MRQVHVGASGAEVIDRGSQVVPASGKITVADITKLSEFAISLQAIYTVTFDAAGGTASEAARAVAEGEAVGALPSAVRAGHAFGGWYDGEAQVDASYVPAGDVTLVAHWTADQDEPTPVERVDMHRMYNPNSGEHFYTASDAERDFLVGVGWSSEGEGWTAPVEGEPVYRLYNPNAGDHHYTRSAGERDVLVGLGWSYEGEGWKTAGDDGVPLYRLYNPNATGAGSHHYTTNAGERDILVSLGWNTEGIGWYGV